MLKEMIENLPELPEVKYYDTDVHDLYEQIKNIRGTIKRLPEPKYYDSEVKSIYKTIESVRQSIPEMPDIPEIKYYDEEVEILERDVSLLFKKVSAIKIPDIKPHQKKLTNFYNEFNERNSLIDSKLEHLECLLSEVYDIQQEQIEEKLVAEEIERIKLEEEITDEPATNKTTDPLTPLSKDFVTFKQLRDHYQLFIRRIQTQLSTIGGGNEITTLTGLNDVVTAGITTNPSIYDGKYLKYDASVNKFVFAVAVGEAGDFTGTLSGLFDTNVTNLQDGYLMIYDAANAEFVWVDPQTYFGINADANPDPNIVDYGTYN